MRLVKVTDRFVAMHRVKAINLGRTCVAMCRVKVINLDRRFVATPIRPYVARRLVRETGQRKLIENDSASNRDSGRSL
jgi:hypothetical protein